MFKVYYISAVNEPMNVLVMASSEDKAMELVRQEPDCLKVLYADRV